MKCNILTYIAALLFLLMMANDGFSTEIAGGQITYTNIGKDSFLVKVTMYRDCNGTPLPGLSLLIKCASNGSTINTLTMTKPSPVDITPKCQSSCTRCQSPSCTFPYGIEKYEYSVVADISGAGSCCDIIFSVNGCCRPNTITTGPDNSWFYIEAFVNRCLAPENNSPVCASDPVFIICLGQDFSYNPSVSDNDRDSTNKLLDSLSFEWISPLSAAGSNVTYTSPYTYDKPLYFWGHPSVSLPFPRGFHLDKNSGEISFRPMKAEQTVMAVKISEWRVNSGSRIKIGESTREFNIIVMSCPNNTFPSLSGPYYKEVCAGDSLTYTITTNDYDTLDTLTISWNKTIPGASWTDSNGLMQHPTGILKWVPEEKDASVVPYVFTVSVKDDACPLPGQRSRQYQILVKPSPKAQYQIADSGCAEYYFNAQAIVGTKPAFIWKGNFNPGFLYTGSSAYHQFNGPGKYPVSLDIIAQGCTNTYYDTIEADTFLTVKLNRENDICYGDSLVLTAGYAFNTGGVKYQWHTGDTLPTITYKGLKDTVYYLEISDSSICTVKEKANIRVHKPPVVNLGADRYLCSSDSILLKPQLTFDRSALKSVEWYKDTLFISSGTTDIRVGDSANYLCKVTDTLGCTGTDSKRIYKNPPVKAYAPSAAMCKGMSAMLEASLTGSQGSSVLYNWYDTTSHMLIGTKRNLYVKPTKTTAYFLVVSETLNGTLCADSAYVLVTVLPLPEISWSMIPERCVDGAVLHLDDYLSTIPTNAGRSWSSPSGALSGADFYPAIAGPGKHKIVVSVSNPVTSCVNKDSIIITINPLPLVNAGMDQTICSGDGAFLLSGIPAFPPGVWRNLLGYGVHDSNGIYFFDPNAPGILDGSKHSLVYKYSDYKGCSSEDTMIMTVYKSPVADAGIDTSLCINSGQILLNGTPLGGIWTGNGLQSGNRFNPENAGKGTHTLVYSYTNVVCAGYDSVFIQVYNSPEVSLFTDDHRTSFCTGFGLVPVYASPSGGLLTGPFSHAHLFNADTTEGKYIFSYSYTDSFGCAFLKSLELETGTPVISISRNDTVFCEGENISLLGTKKNVEKIRWLVSKDADGTFIDPDNQLSLRYKPGTKDISNKRLKFYLVGNDYICKPKTDSVMVLLADTPEVNFYADLPQYHSSGNYYTVQFYDQSVITNPPVNYLWDFGNQTTSILQNPVATYQDTGFYSVELLVIDQVNCSSKATKENYIHVTDVPELTDENVVLVYPNPTDEKLFIKSSHSIMEIRLINSLGKVVRHEHDLNTKEYQLYAFPKGLYLVEITDIDGVRMWRKVVFH